MRLGYPTSVHCVNLLILTHWTRLAAPRKYSKPCNTSYYLSNTLCIFLLSKSINALCWNFCIIWRSKTKLLPIYVLGTNSGQGKKKFYWLYQKNRCQSRFWISLGRLPFSTLYEVLFFYGCFKYSTVQLNTQSYTSDFVLISKCMQTYVEEKNMQKLLNKS